MIISFTTFEYTTLQTIIVDQKKISSPFDQGVSIGQKLMKSEIKALILLRDTLSPIGYEITR